MEKNTENEGEKIMYSIYWYDFKNNFVSCLECGSLENMKSLRVEFKKINRGRYYLIQEVPKQ